MPYNIARAKRVFEKNYIPVTESGCWLWLGVRVLRGYGVMRFLSANYTGAHRASYAMFRGELIPGMHVHHKCHVTCCVNPNHLEQVTEVENRLDSNCYSAVNARKTHCIHGHPLSGNNLYLHRGKRRCRICRAAIDKKRKLS